MQDRQLQTNTAHTRHPLEVKSTIRLVSRVGLEVPGADAFDRTIREAVKWIKRRSPSIPAEAFEGHPFEVGGGGKHPAQAVRIDQSGIRIWAAQLDDPDKDIPRRTWVTELVCFEAEEKATFGVRLYNVTRGEDRPFSRSIPGVVKQIITNCGGMADSWPLFPQRVETQVDFDDFRELLLDPGRRLPVLVVSASSTVCSAVNGLALAQRLPGLVHLRAMTEETSWELTRWAGKSLSVFNGAARLYWPGFDLDDNPYRHRLWLPRLDGEDADQKSDREDGIFELVIRSGLRMAEHWDFPRFDALKQQAAEARLEAAKSNGVNPAELLALYEAEIDDLYARLEYTTAEHAAFVQLADQDLRDSQQALNESKAENSFLKARIASLESASKIKGQGLSDEMLTEYQEIEEWAGKHLAGPIWVAPKAIRETKKNGQFRDLALFSQTLLMLRDLFVPMKKEPSETRFLEYQSWLTENGVEDQPCFANRDAIRGFPEYSVNYLGETLWCENHLKYGSGRDPRGLFRIYYHWHEESQTLVIGHMPSHLDNMMTN